MYRSLKIGKLVNPINQQFKKPFLSILSLGVMATGITLIKTEPASAYCVYNKSDETITALQVPVSSDSFKAVIEPQSDSCCNWSEGSCTSFDDGRYGNTTFLMYKGALDTDGITASEILQEINTTITSEIPVVGGVVEKMYEKLDDAGYGSKEQSLGAVKTYNGGVVWYDGSKAPVGCWTGPCQGQDVNHDGSTGYNPED